MPWWALAVLMLGANFALWGAIGLIRLGESAVARWSAARALRAAPAPAQLTAASPGTKGKPGDRTPARRARPAPSLTTSDVAVLIPAHNEALVIADSLAAIMALVPARNVHVVSDGSTDDTVAIARRSGALVISTQENVGKAGALEEAVARFGLIDRFPVVMLLDADTRVLPHLEMNPPGLVIEDFNMTFEVYQKRLGKVGFTLRAVAVTQDPDNLHDYIRQTKRWAIGLWQTVRRHPPRANLFTAMLVLLLLELITSSVLFFLLSLALLVLLVPDLAGQALSWPAFGELHLAVSTHLTLTAVLFGVVLTDFLITCAVAVLERQPRLLLLAVFFPFMRMLDAAISLYSVSAAWLSVSSGRWKSPARRPVGRATAAALPAAGVPASGAYHAGTRDEPGTPARVAEASHVSG